MTRITLAFAILGLSLSGCIRWKYDKDKSPQDFAKSENFYSDLHQMADDAIDGSMDLYRGMAKSNCATVTLDLGSTPKTMLIDFGTSNCLCTDGKTRRGQVLTSWTGSYGDSGTVITHVPTDYYVNDYQLIGTKVVTNQGTNGQGQPWFTVDIDGDVITPGGVTMDYTSDRIRTWTAGYTTPLNIYDDEYDVTGTASGTNSDGGAYEMETRSGEPIHFEMSCLLSGKLPSSGVLEITPQGKSTRSVDYGNGSCDRTVTISVNGYTINATI